MYNLLLMTSTINSINIQNNYEKIKERTEQYIEAIKYYLQIDNINWIVFIDSNKFDFELSEEFNKIKIYAKSVWKDIEFLSFEQDSEKIKETNYWYWEFQTLEFFQHNSKLLLKTDSFYKVTWRYIINNIYDIIKKSENLDNLVYKFWILDFFTLMTVFFKINKEQLNYIVSEYNNLYDKITSSTSKKLHSIIIAEFIFFELLYHKFTLNTLNIYPYHKPKTWKKYLFYQFLLSIWYLNLNNILIKFIIKISNFMELKTKTKYLKIINIIATKIWS